MHLAIEEVYPGVTCEAVRGLEGGATIEGVSPEGPSPSTVSAEASTIEGVSSADTGKEPHLEAAQAAGRQDEVLSFELEGDGDECFWC